MAASRRAFVAVALFSMCINVLMLTAPIYMLQVFDRVLASGSLDTLILLSAIAAFAILTLAALEAVRHVLVKISVWLDRRLGGALLAAGIVGGGGEGKGSAQGLRDLATFRNFLAGPALHPILDAPWTPIFIAVIFLLHTSLGWVALAGALALFVLAVANEVATRTPLRQSSGEMIGAIRQAEAAARNADAIEAMDMLPNIAERWRRHSAKAVDLQARTSLRSGRITAISKFVRLGIQIGILGAGAALVVSNELTPAAMIAASILLGRALAPVEQAIGGWRSAIEARAAYRRIAQSLATAPGRGEGMRLPTPIGRLTVEGVTFLHHDAAEPVLRNISCNLAPSEALGLIGPTAAGKTTLARLMVGNLTPRVGHVRLDGVDVAEWDPEDLGRHVGYLPQDVQLFSGTVRENIARMGEGDAEMVVEAARLAGVHDLILRLKKGRAYPSAPGLTTCWVCGCHRRNVRPMFCHAQPLEVRPPDVPRRLRGALSR